MTGTFSEEMLTAYLHDELSLDQRRMVEEEMARNPAVKALFEELSQVNALIEANLGPRSGSEEMRQLKSGIEENLDDLMATVGKSQQLPSPTRRRFWKLAIPAIAAGVCVTAASLFALLTYQSKEASKTIVVREQPAGERTESAPQHQIALVEEKLEALGYTEYHPVDSQARRSPRPSSSAKRSSSRSLRARRARPLRAGGRSQLVAQAKEQLPLHDNTESYDRIEERGFLSPKDHPLSTFSIDVDTAAYANVRRFINSGRRPPPDAVRIEELINYFDYDYPLPKGNEPFAVTAEVASAPWEPEHRLLRIGLKGKPIRRNQVKPSNLVFLIDTSGSMRAPNKLGLLKTAMRMLVSALNDDDRIAIVAYAGSAGLVLPPTEARRESVIVSALERLESGGSTNGGEGIRLAYQVAKENFIDDGNNRVILATDGDFNVGITSRGDLVRLIERQRQHHIFLSVLGFGTGNYKDAAMEELSNKGNGNYAYIDSKREAEKVLVREMGGTLHTVAKDVKLQIEFNPSMVQAYRLIGYENRRLAARDFNDDRKDAGEIGAGHAVTALYEIIPHGVEIATPGIDPLKYQVSDKVAVPAGKGEVATLKLRFKKPKGERSRLRTFTITDKEKPLAHASADFKFAAAVAGFGQLLRSSQYRGDLTYQQVIALAQEAAKDDPGDYRTEFITLVKKAASLDR